MRSFSSLFSLRPCFFSPLPFQRQITTTSSLYNPSKAPPQHKSPSHHNKNKTKKPQSHQNQNNYNHKSHNHNHNHNNPHQQKHQQNKHPFQRPLGPNNPNPFQLVQEVKKDEEGMRVDSWIRTHFPQAPFALLQKLLRSKKIGVYRSDRALRSHQPKLGRLRPNDRMKMNEKIAVPHYFEEYKGEKKKKKSEGGAEVKKAIEELENSIIFENDEVLVINKPPGLSIQGGTGISISIQDLINNEGAFQKRGRGEGGEEEEAPPPRPIHRLDKDVGGALVLGKTRKSTAQIQNLFREQKISKVYWALVHGTPSPSSGRIESVFKSEEGREKVATTIYKTLAYSKEHQVSWLQLHPKSGRKHQLRIHCSQNLHTPIANDKKYSNIPPFSLSAASPSSSFDPLEGSRGGEGFLFLFARRMGMDTSTISSTSSTSSYLSFTAPLPETMKSVWRALWGNWEEIEKEQSEQIEE